MGEVGLPDLSRLTQCEPTADIPGKLYFEQIADDDGRVDGPHRALFTYDSP